MISNIRMNRSGIQHRPVLVEVTDVLCILEWILGQQFLMDLDSKARLCGHLEAAIRDFKVQIEDIRSIQNTGPELQQSKVMGSSGNLHAGRGGNRTVWVMGSKHDVVGFSVSRDTHNLRNAAAVATSGCI